MKSRIFTKLDNFKSEHIVASWLYQLADAEGVAK